MYINYNCLQLQKTSQQFNSFAVKISLSVTRTLTRTLETWNDTRKRRKIWNEKEIIMAGVSVHSDGKMESPVERSLSPSLSAANPENPDISIIRKRGDKLFLNKVMVMICYKLVKWFKRMTTMMTMSSRCLLF